MKGSLRRARIVFAASLAVSGAVAVVGPPASAESLRPRSLFTREDGMNAVRYAGDTWTIHDLIERRALAPARFDQNHQRLGRGLRMGLEALDARRALNPRRFDFYHPILGYLLADAQRDPVDSGIGGVGVPDLLPDPIPGPGDLPTIPPVEEPSPPIVVEEPPPPFEPPPLPQEPINPVQPPGEQPIIPPPVTPEPNAPPAVIPEPPGLIQAAVGLVGLAGALAWRRHRGRRPGRLARA